MDATITHLQRTTAAIAAFLMSIVLVGCGSNPPPEYHLLPVKPFIPTPVEPAAYTNPDTPCISLGVDKLVLPEYLNNDNIVGLQTESTVEVFDQKRWYEPLESAMFRALTLQLIQDLPTIRIQDFPWRQDDQPVCRLTVIFYELIQVNHDNWSAKLQWQLHHPPRRTYFSDTSLDIQLSETELAKDLPQAYAYLKAIESTSSIVSGYVNSLPRLDVEIQTGNKAPEPPIAPTTGQLNKK
ncbi:Uncharacterised protein [BD1-7 clade bacterium]|uniref:ABC-type transport auxiliary lipoprotein component domain-containing protein n=1 Tax=BD1-7 clade bacterium TaxID=2029982 RepID=A0A5S9R063_9GAMM|nr:Uncharacterised protein [BD1-7 clade bacterium]